MEAWRTTWQGITPAAIYQFSILCRLHYQIVLNDGLKDTAYELKTKKDLNFLHTEAQARGEWNNL